MTSTTRVPGTEITGIYGALIKTAMRRMLGAVPEAAEVMWHHPTVFKDLMKFGRRTEKWDELDRDLATLAAMAAAARSAAGPAWTCTTSCPTTGGWMRRRRVRCRAGACPRRTPRSSGRSWSTPRRCATPP